MKPLSFNKILPKHFQPIITKMLKKNLRIIEKLLAQKKYTWDNFIAPLEVINERLSFAWTTISHLNIVLGTKEIRAAYEKCLPLVTKYFAEIAQDPQIYAAVNNLTKSQEYTSLDNVQKKILKDKLRDFQLSGVALPKAKKKLFVKLNQNLAKLSNKFSNNVTEATQNHEFYLTKKETKGLPEHALAMGQEAARKKKRKGWLFTLDQPSYQALITFADSRSLRKKVYIAYATRAAKVNLAHQKWDNSKIITEILKIRIKLAKLISCKNYAEYSIATKMVKNTKEVLDFLYDLAKKALPSAKKELKELKNFAQNLQGIKKLEPWDLAYYEEKLRQKKFSLSQEDLRPYFPEDQVIKGIFAIIKRLYGITIKEKKGLSTWHQDVRFFELYDRKQKLQSKLYLDLYCRENKRSGAWMDDYQTRYLLKNRKIQTPIAFLVCNFSPPLNNAPALLTHDDVLTLLHEFGHCLQHLLTKVDYIAASGIKGIPWDAVEIASQFMENWGWQKESIKLLSKHYITKKPLPHSLLKKLLKSHDHFAAIHMLRQLEYSLIDFTLHLEQEAPTSKRLKKIITEIQKKVRVTPNYKHGQPLHSFLHIFAGPYAAGYYSYKWAEVLAADAFSKFTEHGIFNQRVGKEFLSYILETGGSEEPLVLFKKFRGRLPKIDALLQQYGIRN